MSESHQETDSGIVRDSSPECSWSFSLADATIGSEQGTAFPLRGDSDPLRQARKTIPKLKNPSVAEQAQRLLSFMQRMVQLIPSEKSALKHIPPLQAYEDDDGSLSIEWILPDFRVGFNIEPDPQDSGWHLVSNKRLGEITASGHLSNMNEIVAFLLEFILSNI